MGNDHNKDIDAKMKSFEEENHIRKTFNSYESIKKFLSEYIYGKKAILPKEGLKVYLISTKSIPNFISILNEQFKSIKNEEDLKDAEEQLKKKLIEYEIENNAVIYNSRNQCLEVMKNISDNEFIIVSEDFINNFNIEDGSSKYVTIKSLNQDHSMKIEFAASGYILEAEEIKNKKGHFKFREPKEEEKEKEEKEEEKKEEKEEEEKEEKKDKKNIEENKQGTKVDKNITYIAVIKNDNSLKESTDIDYIQMNMPSDVIQKEEENKKNELYHSMIESIVYCLLNIKSLNDYFTKEINFNQGEKYISKNFYSLIQQKLNKNKIDCSNLADQIKAYYFYEPEIQIENIYKILHEELKYKDPKQNSMIISQDLTNPNPKIELMNSSNKFIKQGISIISDLFYFQNIITFVCHNCKKNISYESFIENNIKFSLKDIARFKNNPNSLNIFDCFNYLISDKEVNRTCQHCKMNSVSSVYKINSTQEILTIILDRGNNFKEEIMFDLLFNIDLSNLFFNNENKPQNYELIGFCSYFKAQNICIPFYKNYEDNKWYYLNNSTISFVEEDTDIGSPFLLFYKHVFQ